jgi:transcriptional regulator with XRE-family HTH domain
VETIDAILGRNVAELRDRRRLSVRALSARLAELGHPILASGISKIENGSRRVDVGDLVALALALDVSPVRLLLPGERVDRVQLTRDRSASWEAAWRWAVGEQPLEYLELTDPRVREFIELSRPFERRPWLEEAARGLVAREPPGFRVEIRHDAATGRLMRSIGYGDESEDHLDGGR